MPDEAAIAPQLDTSTGIELWRAFVGALEAAGEAALLGSAKAGVEVVSRLLAPRFERAFQNLERSGTLEAIQEIDRLTGLDDDWDGEGGRAATRGARTQALTVLTQTYAAASFAEKAMWRRPAVSTSGDGGIDLSWIGPDRSVLLVIYGAPETDTVVCVTQSGDAPPQRTVVPVSEAVKSVLWALEDA